MVVKVARFTSRLLPPGLVGTAVPATHALLSAQHTPPPGVHGQVASEPMSLPAAAARTAVPPAVAAGLIALTTLALEAAQPTLALRVARFTNLALTSLLAGNGVGSVLFVHPALGNLPEAEFFRSEQQITRRYPEVMRVLMPATVASCCSVLWLLRNRQAASFRLTLAGTTGFLGVLGTTALELPLNKMALQASPDAPPADWRDLRADWNRFNRVRTLFAVAGWSFLCLGTLVGERDRV